MAIFSFLYQLIVTGLIVLITIMSGLEYGPIYFLIGGFALIVYYISYCVSADFSLAPRDYWRCNRWKIFIKKTGWAISTTLLIVIIGMTILRMMGIEC